MIVIVIMIIIVIITINLIIITIIIISSSSNITIIIILTTTIVIINTITTVALIHIIQTGKTTTKRENGHRNDPPRNDPPRNDPTRNDPTRNDPPRNDPLKRLLMRNVSRHPNIERLNGTIRPRVGHWREYLLNMHGLFGRNICRGCADDCSWETKHLQNKQWPFFFP